MQFTRSIFILFILAFPSMLKAESVIITGDVAYHTEVQRMCKAGSKNAVYTNVDLDGYKQCGEIQLKAYCDAEGRKFIGRGKPPYGYLDCAMGPRIQITSIMKKGIGSIEAWIPDMPTLKLPEIKPSAIMAPIEKAKGIISGGKTKSQFKDQIKDLLPKDNGEGEEIDDLISKLGDTQEILKILKVVEPLLGEK